MHQFLRWHIFKTIFSIFRNPRVLVAQMMDRVQGRPRVQLFWSEAIPIERIGMD